MALIARCRAATTTFYVLKRSTVLEVGTKFVRCFSIITGSVVQLILLLRLALFSELVALLSTGSNQYSNPL